MNIVKKYISKAANVLGYDIIKQKNPFSLNQNVKWLEEFNIRTIFDIGANDGGFATFADKIFPGVKIYSFEPIRSCYDKLLEKKKDISDLIPFNYALGDVNDELDFFINDFSYSSSFLKISKVSTENFPFTQNQTVAKASVKRIDDVYNNLEIKKEVLVKIDVQGFEAKVLNGGIDFFSSIPKIVILETSVKSLYEDEPLFHEIFKIMTSFGYLYSGNLDQLYSPSNGEILQADAIFIKDYSSR